MSFLDDLKGCIQRSFPQGPETYLPYGVSGWEVARNASLAYHREVTACVSCLHEQYGDQLTDIAAQTYFHPASWVEQSSEAGRDRYREITYILNACSVLYPPPEIATCLESRLRQILAHPFDGELQTRHLSMPPENCYVAPTLEDCLALLFGLPLTAELLSFIEKLLTGILDTGAFQLSAHDEPRPAYKLYSYRLSQPIGELLRYLFANEQLSYALYKRCVLYVPEIFMTLYHPGKYSKQPDHALLVTLDGFRQRLVADILDDLTPDNAPAFLAAVDIMITDTALRTRIEPGLHGATYLLRAAHYHMKFELGTLKPYTPFSPASIENAVVRLAQADRIEPGSPQGREKLVEQLKQYPVETLKALVPVAPHAQYYLFEALGWQQVWQLRELAHDILEQARASSEYPDAQDFPNSANPLVGLVDVGTVRQVVDSLGMDAVREVLAVWHETHSGLGDALFLIEAVPGFNRQAVLQGFRRNRQLAIKAFGALPLSGDKDEVLERYLALRQSGKLAQTKFGATRRTTHAAAIQTALMHLAQVAGYPDAESLEWDMETRLASENAAPGHRWQTGEYALSLTLIGGEPGVAVSRRGKLLKSVPASVRQSEVYQEARAALDQSRDQSRRVKSMLEKLMVGDESVSLDRLASLLRVPIAQEILGKLVIRLEGGLFGMFDLVSSMLRDMAGALHPIDRPFIIAHPYHLFQAGQLSDWQQVIVHEHIVQPFRQVFRELYLLTPAEEQSDLYSNRFAGHTIGANVAARLFGSRGWHLTLRAGYQAYRPYGTLRAVITFPGVHTFWGDEAVLTDQVYFEAHPGRERVHLRDIPPLIFSETMRDVDLFVSVAQRDGEIILSNESYEQRRQLIGALLGDLGIVGVNTDGHFAYVQGKLARYRIHLGSAVIHIEPGNYLCIVPAGRERSHDKLNLPFADSGDTKISEVMSKIFLLLADDKINDESILRQIHASAG